MRRRLILIGILATAVAVSVAEPATATHRHRISITVNTTFDDVPDAFRATGVPGCHTGTVVDFKPHVQPLPDGGRFRGYKVFTCHGSNSGFALRLTARFNEFGSTGTWFVSRSWGSLQGMHGPGWLVGHTSANGINDHYRGKITL